MYDNICMGSQCCGPCLNGVNIMYTIDDFPNVASLLWCALDETVGTPDAIGGVTTWEFADGSTIAILDHGLGGYEIIVNQSMG